MTKFFYIFQLFRKDNQELRIFEDVTTIEVLASNYNEAFKKLKTPGLLQDGDDRENIRLMRVIEKYEEVTGKEAKK